jgi:hypothetical protein
MAISNIIGPPVTGDNFYGREAELARAHDFLNTRHSIVLSAPRRIGKSSFAMRLVEDKRKQGWKCVYLDLENVNTEDEFLQSLISEFDKSGIWAKTAKTAGGFISTVLESIKSIGPVKIDYQSNPALQNPYLTLSESIDHSFDTLVVIDELTLFLGVLERSNRPAEDIAYFLNWFRSLRQVTDSRVRWIFCGSIGLHNFTNSRRLSHTINDLAELNFDEMSDQEAFGLVRALAESDGVDMDDEAIRTMLDMLRWNIPYFIQLLFRTIKDNTKVGMPVTASIIQESFNQLVRTEHLNTWSERLGEYNGYEKGARFMLNLLSQSEVGIAKSQMVSAYMKQSGETDQFTADSDVSIILNMLEHDGYIQRRDGKRAFRSPLLKAWWNYKFVE